MATQIETVSVLEVPLHIEMDLESDENGVLNAVAFIYPKNEDECAEVRVEFEEMIDEIIEFYSGGFDNEGSGQLYTIAHELARHSERLREVANRLDDQWTHNDLFDEDDELLGDGSTDTE